MRERKGADMIFRQAKTADLDAVMAVIEDGRTTLANLGLDQWQGSEPSRETIASDISNGFSYLVADDADETVLATVCFWDCGEPDYDRVISGAWLTDSPNSQEAARGSGAPITYAALHRLASCAASRRKGVASFMIRSCFDLACKKGLASVRADTHAGNVPMQRTFEKLGMTRCCEVLISNPTEATKLRIGYEMAL